MLKVMVVLVVFANIISVASAKDVENCLGFSFSPTDAGDRWRCSPVPLEQIHHYFYLANPTPSTLGGFEFAWFADPPLEGPPHDVLVEVRVLGDEDYTGDYNNFIVRFDTPVPTTEYMVLVDYVVFYLDSPLMNLFYVGPSDPAAIPGTPVIFDGSEPTVALPTNFPEFANPESDGFAPLGGIWICPAAEPTSWSTIKALYE